MIKASQFLNCVTAISKNCGCFFITSDKYRNINEILLSLSYNVKEIEVKDDYL